MLIPPHDAPELVIPTWRGNEFLLPDDVKPAIRTFTPSLMDAATRELELDVVLHGPGVASEWAAHVRVGDLAAVSGPGRGYTINNEASDYLIGGDESAIPAIRQLLVAMPTTIPTRVYIEVTSLDARGELVPADHLSVDWLTSAPGAPPGTALADAAIAAPIERDTHVWIAGEAAAVQRIRRHFFTERDFPRTRATIRGYWKHGRASAGD